MQPGDVVLALVEVLHFLLETLSDKHTTRVLVHDGLFVLCQVSLEHSK